MKGIGNILSAIILFLLFSQLLFADSEGDSYTPEEVKVMELVERVHAFVKENSEDMDYVQQNLISNPDFSDMESQLYIFIHTYDIEKKEAICRGHGARPELLGKNMWSLRTPNGRLLFHEEALMIEQDGEGWMDYDWLNPFSNSLQNKHSFFKGIVLADGQKAWVGCGIWREL